MSSPVTFLLTEVVDSVRLWEDDEDGMAVATDRLDHIVKAAVAAHNGKQVKPRGEGDSHFLIFDDPVDAIACAVDLQRALAGETALAIRSGCNVGFAELRDDDWYGVSVNRCARLRAAAHGRQSLVSAEVAAAVRTSARSLPEGIEMKSLGLHRLKDLDEPTEVFQLCADGLVPEHPELATLTRSHGLHLPRSSFVGRDSERERVTQVLNRGGVATITGAPGVGTTRLVLESAATWWEQSGRPIRLLTDPQSPEEVAAARLSPGELVIIDGADLGFRSRSASLEGPAAVTAGSPLGFVDEVVIRLYPLGEADADQLLQNRLADSTSLPVALVAHCDGLPLAIELLARRAASIDAGVLADRLAQDPLTVLGGDRRAEPARHSSLRATLAAAFALLDERGRADLLAARPGDPRWVAAGWHEQAGPLPLIARFLAESGGRG